MAGYAFPPRFYQLVSQWLVCAGCPATCEHNPAPLDIHAMQVRPTNTH